MDAGGTRGRTTSAGSRAAASRYAGGGVRDVAPGAPGEILGFTRAVLAAVQWRPDDLFMLDVCESDGGPRVVELNSFSCSWLYACDLTAVVEDASWLAANATTAQT